LVDRNDKKLKIKPKKVRMCEEFKEGKPCLAEEGKCKFAHYAHELELIPIANKVKNLTNVKNSQNVKLRHSKPPMPFKPAS